MTKPPTLTFEDRTGIPPHPEMKDAGVVGGQGHAVSYKRPPMPTPDNSATGRYFQGGNLASPPRTVSAEVQREKMVIDKLRGAKK